MRNRLMQKIYRNFDHKIDFLDGLIKSLLKEGVNKNVFWPLFIFPAKPIGVICRMKDDKLPIILMPNLRDFYWIIGVKRGYLHDILNS